MRHNQGNNISSSNNLQQYQNNQNRNYSQTNNAKMEHKKNEFDNLFKETVQITSKYYINL